MLLASVLMKAGIHPQNVCHFDYFQGVNVSHNALPLARNMAIDSIAIFCSVFARHINANDLIETLLFLKDSLTQTIKLHCALMCPI